MRTVNSTTVGLMSLAAALVWLPATASAIDGQTVNVSQTARRTVGQCTYETRLEGHYQTVGTGDRGVPVREALVNVTTRLDCRGVEPKFELRQIYFAETTEEQLMSRLAEATRVENPGSHGTCGFAPALVRSGATVLVTDIVASCTEARPSPPLAVNARARTR